MLPQLSSKNTQSKFLSKLTPGQFNVKTERVNTETSHSRLQ